MVKTYNRTMFISNEELPERKVLVDITKGLKWEDNDEETFVYTGLVEWSIIDGEDAIEIERYLNIDEDENHEYLVLKFNDGKVITFRNSHVDMFIR